MDDKKDDLVHVSSFLTGLGDGNFQYVVDGSKSTIANGGELLVDWSEPVYDFTPPVNLHPDHHWITAIQKVSPKSGAFWYDYGHRYNEKVMLEIRKDKDPQGRRCCDVKVYSKRTVGDVVLSAWEEYNKYLVPGLK